MWHHQAQRQQPLRESSENDWRHPRSRCPSPAASPRGFKSGRGGRADDERQAALRNVARLFREPEALGVSRNIAIVPLTGFDLQAAEFEQDALCWMPQLGAARRSSSQKSLSPSQGRVRFQEHARSSKDPRRSTIGDPRGPFASEPGVRPSYSQPRIEGPSFNYSESGCGRPHYRSEGMETFARDPSY
mmetsp:Transcript_85607/g.242784  ORF Transcript_85607/g.242784 Transcript_85607/m.242784 type:complete len:188 (-) Transcript_85607:131-694(-)